MFLASKCCIYIWRNSQQLQFLQTGFERKTPSLVSLEILKMVQTFSMDAPTPHFLFSLGWILIELGKKHKIIKPGQVLRTSNLSSLAWCPEIFKFINSFLILQIQASLPYMLTSHAQSHLKDLMSLGAQAKSWPEIGDRDSCSIGGSHEQAGKLHRKGIPQNLWLSFLMESTKQVVVGTAKY